MKIARSEAEDFNLKAILKQHIIDEFQLPNPSSKGTTLPYAKKDENEIQRQILGIHLKDRRRALAKEGLSGKAISKQNKSGNTFRN